MLNYANRLILTYMIVICQVFAGDGGIGPPTFLLERNVIPLHQSPIKKMVRLSYPLSYLDAKAYFDKRGNVDACVHDFRAQAKKRNRYFLASLKVTCLRSLAEYFLYSTLRSTSFLFLRVQ